MISVVRRPRLFRVKGEEITPSPLPLPVLPLLQQDERIDADGFRDRGHLVDFGVLRGRQRDGLAWLGGGGGRRLRGRGRARRGRRGRGGRGRGRTLKINSVK